MKKLKVTIGVLLVLSCGMLFIWQVLTRMSVVGEVNQKQSTFRIREEMPAHIDGEGNIYLYNDEVNVIQKYDKSGVFLYEYRYPVSRHYSSEYLIKKDGTVVFYSSHVTIFKGEDLLYKESKGNLKKIFDEQKDENVVEASLQAIGKNIYKDEEKVAEIEARSIISTYSFWAFPIGIILCGKEFIEFTQRFSKNTYES